MLSVRARLARLPERGAASAAAAAGSLQLEGVRGCVGGGRRRSRYLNIETIARATTPAAAAAAVTALATRATGAASGGTPGLGHAAPVAAAVPTDRSLSSQAANATDPTVPATPGDDVVPDDLGKGRERGRRYERDPEGVPSSSSAAATLTAAAATPATPPRCPRCP